MGIEQYRVDNLIQLRTDNDNTIHALEGGTKNAQLHNAPIHEIYLRQAHVTIFHACLLYTSPSPRDS